MTATVGVDIGTQGVKAALFTTEGRRLATAFRPSRLRRPAPGVVEEDPEFQLDGVCAAIRSCLRSARLPAGEVAAVAVDGQMAGVIGVGPDGRHVTPYDSWLDTRCAPQIARMNRRAGDEIIARTGGPASFNHGPKKLWWREERPKDFRRVRAFVQPGGYAAMRLCGLGARDAFIDTTYLHFTGFADSQRAAWDAGLCRRFDFDEAKLPRIVRPATIVGGIVPALARRCGLRAGTPVAAGCGDTAASFLACGATRPGLAVDVAGTAAVFAATTRVFKADLRSRVLGCGHAVVPGLWHPYAYINGAGMNLEWFAREFAGAGRRPLDLRSLDREAARLQPEETAPFFVPHLGGRVSPSRPHLRGAWAGLGWNHERAHLWRALLEGVALEYAGYFVALRRLYPRWRLEELRVTGGGGRSALWNRIKAGVLGAPVAVIKHHDGAPLGAALLAAHAVGLVPDLDAGARRWIEVETATPPDPAHEAVYAARRRRYRSLLQTLESWSTQ